MDLILWRHADAQAGDTESARALTGKGRRQAVNIAGWLEKHLPDSSRIIVSPAVQAAQTAEGLGRKFRILAELAPGPQSASPLVAADWPESRPPVVLIRPQPSSGRRSSLLPFGPGPE